MKTKPNGFFALVLHPESIGRAHRIMLLEQTIQYIMQKNDVWFCRMADLASRWKD